MTPQDNPEDAGADDRLRSTFPISLLHAAWVGELELPGRALTIFKREGIVAVAFIENATDAELLRFRGLGPDTLREIRDAVNRFRDRWHKWAQPFKLASEIAQPEPSS